MQLARNMTFPEGENNRILHQPPATTSSSKAPRAPSLAANRMVDSNKANSESPLQSHPTTSQPQGQSNSSYTFKGTAQPKPSTSSSYSKPALTENNSMGVYGTRPPVSRNNTDVLNQRQNLFKPLPSNNAGETGGWGLGQKKDFWNLGGGQRPGNFGSGEEMGGGEMDGGGQRSRSVHYPNNTGT